MAETAAILIAEVAASLALEQLIAFIDEKSKLLKDFPKEVKDIKVDLVIISDFLRDADTRAVTKGNNDGMTTLMQLIREAAYGVEDVIDECTRYVEKRRDRHGFKAVVNKKIARPISSWNKKPKLVLKIRELRQSIHEIVEKSKKFRSNTVPDQGETGETSKGHVDDPRAGLHFVENDALVGIESPENELVKRLRRGSPERTVISLWGMGGIGKTTLANKIYEDNKKHFECHACITVSQSYQRVQLLRSMIRLFREAKNDPPLVGINDMMDEELIRKSREYLSNENYVVVFDDVWNEDFWQVIQSALPQNNNRSRIIITTRNKDVAESCRQSPRDYVHELKHLSLDKSQELLCRTAFRMDQQKDCPDNLKDVSFKIARKCDGLPLALVAIGALLSTKEKAVSEWKRLNKNLAKQLKSNPRLTYVKTILSYSYFDLPHHLRSCFLYVGVFPRYHNIPSKKLIRLWIAEGLVKKVQGMTLEEIGQSYLTMLINRSLVQVGWCDSTGRVRTCRVHDTIQEVLLTSKSEERKLTQSSEASSNGAARYLWFDNSRACDLSRRNGNFQTHSIIFCNPQELPESPFRRLSLNFKLLREVDFENAPMESLSEEIGKLWHLRYLSLRSSKIKKLPRSIGKLQNLLTLDLKGSSVVEFPDEIRGLCNLQYLAAYSTDHDNHYTFDTDQGVTIKGSVIGSLESLEKLYYVDFQPKNAKKGEDFGRELGRLRRLRKLGITKLRPDCGEALCGAIQQMPDLQALRISAVKQDAVLKLHSMISPPTSLERLRLHGQLEQLPDWISKLENLVKISLHWSRISDDSLEILGGLPELMEFWLHEGHNGDKLYFKQGQFKKLKHLSLVSLKQLAELVIERGSLPCLENLEIGPSPLLKEVPTNICELKSLKNLEFADMPKEFAKRVLPSQGPDYRKVEAIPNVCFRYTTQGLHSEAFKLGDSRFLKYLYI